MKTDKVKISIIGLGYVGLPLACLFATKYKVVGFDIKTKRVLELQDGYDSTLEVNEETLNRCLKSNLTCTTDKKELKECNIHIVTVPTPVNKYNVPDLSPLEKASHLVGEIIKKGDIVIYESTVYPGITENICMPIIEEVSGLVFNQDFFAGYSPERINPGDKEHRVENIRKITSGSTPQIADFIDNLYNSVLHNGTYKASSIKVAEAAKIIENSQRDVNIAFMNEIAIILESMNIDTNEVIDAAATKWNFLPFRPGLVGGHCISVDPYYLIQKAQMNGIIPRLMTEARQRNDRMGGYVANQVVNCMTKNSIIATASDILILGFTFKENCPDCRNTKVIDVYKNLLNYSCNVVIYDPWVDKELVEKEYNINIETNLLALEGKTFDAIIHCVSHSCFKKIDFSKLRKRKSIIYDVKGTLNKDIVTKRL